MEGCHDCAIREIVFLYQLARCDVVYFTRVRRCNFKVDLLTFEFPALPIDGAIPMMGNHTEGIIAVHSTIASSVQSSKCDSDDSY